jgi:hypothetical protein
VKDSKVNQFFPIWRASLQHSLVWFQSLRGRTAWFPLKTFLFFCAVNLAFFWWALLTAYPRLLFGPKAEEYVLIGFPVSFLGAIFDCVSLAATLYIVGRALRAESDHRFLAYLSVDLVIAVLAGLWVLFAFMVSGWLVSLVLSVHETLTDRSHLYQGRIESLMTEPLSRDNLRNLYFGVIMGASALFPTLFHLFLVSRSLLKSSRARSAAGGRGCRKRVGQECAFALSRELRSCVKRGLN